MTRMVRQTIAAALVAGFGLPAVIARAAEFEQAYWPALNNSQVQLASATDDVSPSDSAGRASNPRAADSSTDHSTSQSATYPPKSAAKKTASKSAAQPAAKSGSDSSDTRSAVAAKQQPAPNSAIRRSAAPPPRLAATNHRDSELTAHFTADAEPAEGVKKAGPPMPPPPADAAASTEPMTPGEGGCGGSCDACCDCPVWCGGIDYLYLRTNFGNDLAIHRLTATTVGDTVTQNDRAINFDYGFDTDFRVFVGRRMGEGELRFAYEHIQGDANVNGTADGGFANGSGVAFQGLGGTQIDTAGESVTATSHLHLNLFDIDRVQRLDLPGCMECGSPWDVLWSYGVRIADVSRDIDEQDPVERTHLDSTFVGAGPRIGIEARRNICGTRFSGFFSANAGLLVGRYHSHFSNTTPGELQTTVVSQDNNLTRAVPNAQLAIGVSWHPTCHTTLTSGWMVEAFTDAVGSTANTGGCTNCNMINPLAGSGNILSFDGLFIRMEHCF